MPSISVAAIITRSENNTPQILLTKRSSNLKSFPNTWVLPGGKVDEYETREKAVIREVKEETGLDFHPISLFQTYEEIFKERQIHALVTIYIGTSTGNLHADEFEVSEAVWYPLDDILSSGLEFGFEHRKIIHDYISTL